ncbi:hypothetical protein TNCV_1805221 [Trichonephila clavipes]|nr:hypothetical protein TNCV_1805221 [Trichonephila clavipes]
MAKLFPTSCCKKWSLCEVSPSDMYGRMLLIEIARFFPLSQHTSMTGRDIVAAFGIRKSSASKIINQQKNFGAVALKRKSKCGPKCFFAMLPVLGKKAVLEWCMKGLIGSYVCPKCGKSMELREITRKKVNDGF